MDFKVGDYFILPGNTDYKSVYRVTDTRDGYYWAYFPEKERHLYSPPKEMRHAKFAQTKLWGILNG